MYMILLVLPDTDKLYDLIDSWNEAGSPGATILLSTGMASLGEGVRRFADDFPMFPSLHSFLLDHAELQSRTVFSIVPDMEMAEKIVQATEKVTGPLAEPNTGILVVIPLAKVYGLRQAEAKSPPTIR